MIYQMHYFIDKLDCRVTDHEYYWASPFKNGLACVKHPQCGVCFIDKSGHVKVSLPKYQTEPTSIRDGRILIGRERVPGANGFYYGFADLLGHESISPQFIYANDFSEGVASVQVRDVRKFAFIKQDGTLVSTPVYNDLKALSNGLGVAKSAENLFFVNANMEIIHGPFFAASTFHENIAYVECNNLQMFIDSAGKIIFENEWERISRICVQNRIVYINKGLYGFLDGLGKIVVPASYTEAGFFSEDIAIVKTVHGSIIGINTNGETLFESKYKYVGEFNNGLARFKRNNKYGFIDKVGRVVIQPKYSWAGDFSEGLAVVEDG